jgi:hypothetical protein
MVSEEEAVDVQVELLGEGDVHSRLWWVLLVLNDFGHSQPYLLAWLLLELVFKPKEQAWEHIKDLFFGFMNFAIPKRDWQELELNRPRSDFDSGIRDWGQWVSLSILQLEVTDWHFGSQFARLILQRGSRMELRGLKMEH